MTEDSPEVDLDVSGPTATAIAGSILSICEEASDPNSVTITLSHEGNTVTLAGEGESSVEIVPEMVSAIDWNEVGLDAISVQMSEATADTDDDFEPPEQPSHGDRLSPWERSDGGIAPVQEDTNRYKTLAYVAEHEPVLAEDLTEELGYDRAYSSSVLSTLYGKSGLLDRARVYNGSGGLSYMYRLNDHGRAVLKG